MRIIFSPGGTEQKVGGISRYVFELAQHLSELGETTCLHSPILQNSYFLESSPNFYAGWAVPRPIKLPGRLTRLVNRTTWKMLSGKNLPDVYHHTYYTDCFSQKSSSPKILTVYDMIHEVFPAQFKDAGRISELKYLACEKADRIISISKSTTKDLVQIFNVSPDKISTVHLSGSLSPTVNTNSFLPISPHYGRFILYVGSREKYKNFDKLLTSLSLIPAFMAGDFSLVAFGGKLPSVEELELIRRLRLPEKSVHFVRGGDHALSWHYENAVALSYPSLYEGFGIPPLEAMSAGCPVIAGDNSSLPEVVGDAGLLVDTSNPHDLARAISAVNEDSDLRLTLSEKGFARAKLFSWEKTARETLDVYRSVLSL